MAIPTRGLYDHNIGTSVIGTPHEYMILKTGLDSISTEISFGTSSTVVANNLPEGFCHADSLVYDSTKNTNGQYPNAISIVPLISSVTNSGDAGTPPLTGTFRVYGLSGIAETPNTQTPVHRIHRLLASVVLTRTASNHSIKFPAAANPSAQITYFTFSHGVATSSLPGVSPIIYNGSATSSGTGVANPPMHFIVDLLDCTSVATTFSTSTLNKYGFAYNLF